MTHEDHIAACRRLLDPQMGIGVGLDSSYVEEGDAATDAIAVASAFLASQWQTDFDQCPRDRPVLLLWYWEGRVQKLTLDNIADHIVGDIYCPTFWREFVPPTRKEGE